MASLPVTVAGLRLEAMAELALAALAGDDRWSVKEKIDRRTRLVVEGLQYLRVDLDLLPEAWRRRYDATQIDGRVRIVKVWEGFLELETFDDTMFTVTLTRFVEAVLDGHVLDSQ